MTKEKGLEIKSMHIKYIFDENELKEIAQKLAAKTSEKQSLEDKKKEVTSQLTGEINGASAAVSRYSKIYNQGYEYKNADCYEIFDYDTKQVFVHRADTDDQVSVRTMSAIEFQREIFDPREELKEMGEKLVQDFPKQAVERFNDELLKDETIKKGAK
jgi:hypothetical protein